MLRFLALVVMLLSAAASPASGYEYIVPISGNARSDALYVGSVIVINPGPHAATVRVAELIRSPGAAECTPTPDLVLQPGELGSVGAAYSDPFCTGIFAVVLVTDHPVVIFARVISYSIRLPGGDAEMRIDAATRWIEPDEQALIPGVPIARAFAQRANLVIVNAENRPLNVRVRLFHAQFRHAREETLTVPPHSVVLEPLREVEDPGPGSPFPSVLVPEHHLTIEADGRFQAGAAAIRHVGLGTYRPAIILLR